MPAEVYSEAWTSPAWVDVRWAWRMSATVRGAEIIESVCPWTRSTSEVAKLGRRAA